MRHDETPSETRHHIIIRNRHSCWDRQCRALCRTTRAGLLPPLRPTPGTPDFGSKLSLSCHHSRSHQLAHVDHWSHLVSWKKSELRRSSWLKRYLLPWVVPAQAALSPHGLWAPGGQKAPVQDLNLFCQVNEDRATDSRPSPQRTGLNSEWPWPWWD